MKQTADERVIFFKKIQEDAPFYELTALIQKGVDAEDIALALPVALKARSAKAVFIFAKKGFNLDRVAFLYQQPNKQQKIMYQDSVYYCALEPKLSDNNSCVSMLINKISNPMQQFARIMCLDGANEIKLKMLKTGLKLPFEDRPFYYEAVLFSLIKNPALAEQSQEYLKALMGAGLDMRKLEKYALGCRVECFRRCFNANKQRLFYLEDTFKSQKNIQEREENEQDNDVFICNLYHRNEPPVKQNLNTIKLRNLMFDLFRESERDVG